VVTPVLSAEPISAAVSVVDGDFSAESYAAHVGALPSLDGYRSRKCDLRFGGVGALDRTSESDVELMRAARLNSEVLLLVRGTVTVKSFRMNADGEGLDYSFTVKVTEVEAAETA
jgi:hypothetical protein